MLSPRTTALVLMIFLVLVYGSIAQPVQGSPIYTPGIKAGDGAWYGYSGIDVPLQLHVVVLNVAGTVVNANFTNYYSDGKANSSTVYLDIFSGNNNETNAPFATNVLFATGTGLKAGDSVYNRYAATIVSVQTQPCGGVSRTVDFIAFSGLAQLWWDQNTGLMCKFNGQNQESLVMFNTTLWNSHPQPTDAFLVGFEVSTFLGAPLVVLIVFVFLRKRRRARK
ncbi:MAG TPA: hypothetical protein VNW25_05920 [Candidatus Sulfotelmatobacter sp.]|nr:hypothetical protein [Candidatus Sulfotelmatobacter sp.]